MLKSWINAEYELNYWCAVGDGHQEDSARIAWEWTYETMIRQFHNVKGQREAAQQEAINKAFFG